MSKKNKNLHKLDSLVKVVEESPAGKAHIHELEEALATYAQQKKKDKFVIEQTNKDNTIRFIALGDTQFGSLYERADVYKAAFKLAQDEGITDILHTGDVLDGHHVYKGQEFELHQHGWERQSKWFSEQVPFDPKITTYFITGNHDASFKKEAGIEPGLALNQMRPDWKFLGNDVADVTLQAKNGKKYTVALIHPGGGSSFAISYKSQKIVDQWSGGTKPQMLLIGHFHKAEFLPSYRNVSVLQTGCCQAQTPFMARMALAAHVGFWVLSVTPGGAYNRVKAEFVAVYK